MIDCCNILFICPIIVRGDLRPRQRVVTVFGHQEDAAVGYNPRYRGKRSYNPLLCVETNSTYLWDTELRAGNAGTWGGSIELLDTCFNNVDPSIREIRLRADSGFGFNPVLQALEEHSADYVVVARMTKGLRAQLPGLRYQPVNRIWEMAEFHYRPHGWPHARYMLLVSLPYMLLLVESTSVYCCIRGLTRPRLKNTATISLLG